MADSPRPRERFEVIAAAADVEIDLDEAALWIAAEEYPDLDVAGYLAKLDTLAASAREQLDSATSHAARVDRLNRFLFVEQGFAGNRGDYYDPRNSYLNEVLDRRAGIPITLSIVYMSVARRLEMAVRGVSFPGHFLLKSMDDDEIVIDAFQGSTLSIEDCRERLAAASGGQELLPELHLRAAGPREILVRMLNNLKQIFVRRHDWERALDSCERILLLLPDSPLELRDRGLVLEQLACFHAAQADLDRFLQLAPVDPSAAGVRARRDALRARVGRLN